MRVGIVLRYIGLIVTAIGVFMLLAAGVGILFRDGSAQILLMPGFGSIALGAFLAMMVKRPQQVNPRETVAVVVGAWIFAGILGAVPFILYGAPFNIINALFESFSGFTTTGATILTDIESLPKGLLFWRSLTHFIGGVGIIVLALAVFPLIGRGSHALLRREYTGIASPPPLPRAQDISRVVVTIYLLLIALETTMLILAGLSIYDATTTAFSTIATGGLSVRNASIASYNSVAVEIIVTIFMFLGGVNFAFMFSLISRGARTLGGWEIFRVYLFLQILSIILVTVVVRESVYSNWFDALRYAAFECVSQGSSTGFAVVDTNPWPDGAKSILIILTIICACGGSTSGAMKIDRFLLMLKMIHLRLRSAIHPNLVGIIRVDGQPIEPAVGYEAVLYIVAYLTLIGLSLLLLTFMGVGLLEAFTGSAACMGNVGPGFGSIGSMGNYAALPGGAKVTLFIIMLAGRLEIFTLILPFTRGFWRK